MLLSIQDREFICAATKVSETINCPFDTELIIDTFSKEMEDSMSKKFVFDDFSEEQRIIIQELFAYEGLKNYHVVAYWAKNFIPDVINYVVCGAFNECWPYNLTQISCFHISKDAPYVMAKYDMGGLCYSFVEFDGSCGFPKICNMKDMEDFIRANYPIAGGVVANIYTNKVFGDCSKNGITNINNSLIMLGENVPAIYELNEIINGAFIDYVDDKKNGIKVAYPLMTYGIGYYKSEFAFGGNFVYSPDPNLGLDAPMMVYDYRKHNDCPLPESAIS